MQGNATKIIKTKKLHPAATVPLYATAGAANFDLHALIEDDQLGAKPLVVSPGQRVIVRTGLAFEVPPEWVMAIYSRSGHGFKNGVRLSNCVGQIDSDFRGEVQVAIHNDSRAKFTIRHGDRIAQARLEPAPQCAFEVVDELSTTARGERGYGSTGQ